jgi:hypothetical protein
MPLVQLTDLTETERVVADDGFTCRGALRLGRAEIGGVLSLERAVLHGSGDVGLSSFRVAEDIAKGGFDDTEWSASVAFSGRHLTAQELILLPAQPPGGLVDLRHAKVGLLRDAPATWPPGLRVDGLSYEAITDVDRRDARLRWLRDGQVQVGAAVEQRGAGDLEIQAGELGAEAVVGAVAEAELTAGVTGEVEPVGVVVSAWVAVGGVLGEQYRFARGDGAAAERDVFVA